MKSMTGYGAAERRLRDGGAVSVEISSLNRKQLDIRVNAPDDLAFFEIEARRLTQAVVGRGSVVVRITPLADDESAGGEPEINEKVAGVYLRKVRKLKERLGIVGEPTLSDILALPGVVQAGEKTRYDEVFTETAREAVKAALERLDASRGSEGEFITNDLRGRLDVLTKTVSSLEGLASGLVDVAKKRLLERLKEAGLPIQPEDERLLKEVVLYADRGDVSEELTRLRAHLAKFKELLGSGESTGRSLDFLTQEIQREINTLGNKAPSPDISPLVVAFKTEVEKIREQVQNLE